MFCAATFAHADAVITGFGEIIVKPAGLTFCLPIRLSDLDHNGSCSVGFHFHVLPTSRLQRVTDFPGSAELPRHLSAGRAWLKSDSLAGMGREEQTSR
jgi:hypothetical protein